jgi:cysteine desulfurase
MAGSALTEPIYFDYAATTPLDRQVAEAMQPWLAGIPANAASSHYYGERARPAVDAARAAVAALIGASEREVVFTSGATEANNLAILGLARGLRARRGAKPGHLIASKIEHKAVLDPLHQLEREGHAVTWLEPERSGLIAPASVGAALRDDTVLVAVMHANNELGTINEIAAIGALCRARGAALLVDAAQTVGKIPVDVEAMQADLLSLSAHKFYGPQGAGVLWVRTPWRALLQPLQFGGGQERGLRSGTTPIHQLVGLGKAAHLALTQQPSEAGRLLTLRDRLIQGALALGGVQLNGAAAPRLPGIASLSFDGVHGEALVRSLAELALSTSAACNADSDEPSYVLRALGLDSQQAQATLRLSVGRGSSEAEVDRALAALRREVPRLRQLALLQPVPAGWREGRSGARELGTQIQWFLRVDDNGRVAEAGYRCFAAFAVAAVCQALAGEIKGRERRLGPPGAPREWAARWAVPATQLGALLLVEDALAAALA